MAITHKCLNSKGFAYLVAIRGYSRPWLFVAKSYFAFVAIRGYPWLFVAIRGYSCVAIRGYSWLFWFGRFCVVFINLKLFSMVKLRCTGMPWMQNRNAHPFCRFLNDCAWSLDGVRQNTTTFWFYPCCICILKLDILMSLLKSYRCFDSFVLRESVADQVGTVHQSHVFSEQFSTADPRRWPNLGNVSCNCS